MTRLEKNNIYDEMCGLLTDFEEYGDESYELADELYEMLVKIQNNWDELTSEDF